MNEKYLKYAFRLLAFLLLVIMLYSARNAGISCDEILHYGQSVKVYNYFTTGGADKSALQDSDLNLKYYGQTYDNFVTFVTKWTGIEDIYLFRHIMSTIMGWLTIVVTALFAKWLKDYRAAILVLLLFAVSPVFIGHSYNNLKDVPFAFACIAGIWFICRFLDKSGRVKFSDALLLTLSIAFCISIRAGGLILICYLFLFFGIFYAVKYFEKGKVNSREIIRKASWISALSLVAFLLSTVLWPYGLQDPLRNIIDSYKVMAHYPATFRQLFEGKVEWSDFMPWYYIFKSMGITIPLVVLLTFAAYFAFIRKILSERKRIYFGFLVFTVFFPLVFVVLENSNLYSSWRQFLFVYPGMIIIAAMGILYLLEAIRNKYLQLASGVFLLILAIHPVKFMVKNHPYEYIYHNELVGGVNGAFADYELDYYYTSQTEAAEWLIDHLSENKKTGPVRVAATYSVDFSFRKHPDVEVSWIRFEERSMHDWDYAIVVNRYIPPFQLENKIWPPENAVHVIYADDVPICAVVKRLTKEDYKGYQALNAGRYVEAAEYFRGALKVNSSDEMIFYNFAAALYNLGEYHQADSVLKSGLELNPLSDLILMYFGNIYRARGNAEEAIEYYRRVIDVNRKYFEAYVSLSELLAPNDVLKARELLRMCLRMNPRYKPAIIALGDTYKDSSPEIAEKYYQQAKRIN